MKMWCLIDPPRAGAEASAVLRQLGMIRGSDALMLGPDVHLFAAMPHERHTVVYGRDGPTLADADLLVDTLPAQGLPRSADRLRLLSTDTLMHKLGLTYALTIEGALNGNPRYANIAELLEGSSKDPAKRIDLRPTYLTTLTFDVTRGDWQQGPVDPATVFRRLVNSHHNVYRSGHKDPLHPDDIAKWMLAHPDVGELFKGISSVHAKS